MIRPKTTRNLVIVTKDEAGPGQLPFDLTPDAGLFGDGDTSVSWSEVIEYAREVRRIIDAEGRVGWVWIGHDGAFLCDFWVWFMCLGPVGWASPAMAASEKSAGMLLADRKAEEMKRWDAKYPPGGKKRAKSPVKKGKATGDDIVDMLSESGRN